MKKTIRLIHWNDGEARERASSLNKKNFNIIYTPFSPSELKQLKSDSISLFIIDLSRLPSHGRDLGIFFRKNKITRKIPIIYVGGDLYKIVKIKALIPDALYTIWDNIDNAITTSLSQKLENPLIPKTVFAGYEGVPLIKKLGVKPNSRVAIINEPKNIKRILGKLPEGVALLNKLEKPDLIIWFVISTMELEKNVVKIKSMIGKDGLWIAYPKKSSKVKSDLNQSIVRDTGLAVGLVDFKVCSINETWTGLKFAIRKSKEAKS
jgi:hypothetical protein